jgi:hypothetical protein
MQENKRLTQGLALQHTSLHYKLVYIGGQHGISGFD